MKSPALKFLLPALAMLTFAVQAAEPSPNLANQLTEARAQLEVLKQKYSDQHPMVREQKAKIASLEQQLPKNTPATSSPESAQRTFSLDFPGGSLRAFLAAMAKIEGVSLSVIAAGEQSDLETQLPPFSLKNTTVMTTVQVLSRLLQPRGLDLSPMSSDPSVVAVLSRRDAPKPGAIRPPPTMFDSFPLGTYLAEQTIDDIVGAIRAGWELDPSHDKEALRLKFHPGTSILLVSGPPEAIQIAGKVISQLKGAYDKDSKSNLRKLSPNPEPTKR